jgi:MFS transporter, OFA family, oxalate/formate antiporter
MSAARSRRFHGWIMLGIAVLLAVATMPGQTVLVALFNDSYRGELDLSITELSAAYTIGTLLAALPITWVGRLADRHGLRVVTAAVASLFVLALVALSRVQGVVTLGLCFFAIRCLGQGCLGMLSGHVIAMWFERRLGMAHAVVSLAGFGAGAALLPQPTAWAITELGWRTTLLVLAAFVAVLTLPALATVFRNRPEDVGQHVDGEPARPRGELQPASEPAERANTASIQEPAFTLTEALRTRAFWVCTITTVFGGLVGTALIFHMSPLLQSAGLDGSPREVALAVQPWPIAFGVFTLLAGWLVDRYRPAPLLGTGALLLGGAMVLVVASTTVAAAMVLPLAGAGMGLFGASQAIIVGTATPTIARYFGRTHHGAIRGALSSIAVASTGVGPLLFGLGHDLADGSFAPFLVGAAACSLPLALAALSLRPPARPAR